MDRLNVAQRFTVTVGSPVTISTETLSGGSPLTLSAIPGVLGTLLVEYQLAPNGRWFEWPAGAVTTASVYLLTGPVYALRFTAATTDGVVEMVQ